MSGNYYLQTIKDPSGRAKCQSCRLVIQKDQPAVSVGNFYFHSHEYFHLACIVKALAGGLLAAGKSVVGAWEHGDLAGAVRELDSEIYQIEREGD